MNELVKEISKIKEVQAPDWAKFVKTGAHKQRPPTNKDWWEMRTASILKKVNKYGPVGVNKLAKAYGGRKNRGVRPDKKVNASRNIIRKCMQQLEKAGLIKQISEPTSGKVLTKKGKELINKTIKVD